MSLHNKQKKKEKIQYKNTFCVHIKKGGARHLAQLAQLLHYLQHPGG